MKNTIFYFKQLILSFLLCFVAIWANAQNQVVKGTVKDVLGEAVIGANVTEVGTTNGTITDINGDFSLNVSPKGKLRISFIGYQVQTVDVAGRKSLEIATCSNSLHCFCINPSFDEFLLFCLGLEWYQ